MPFFESIKRALRSVEPYIEAAVDAVADGTLPPGKKAYLDSVAARLDMSPQERAAANTHAIERMIQQAINENAVNPPQMARINSAGKCLAVDSKSLSPSITARLNHVLQMQQIAAGHLPVLPVGTTPLSLQAGEDAHFATNCHVTQEKVVGREYHGHSGGPSFRICRGVSYRLGSYSGRSVPITKDVVVSRGLLILTSKRAVYLADKIGFNADWSKVNAVVPYSNAIEFYFTNKQNASRLLYDQHEDASYIEAICAHLLK